MAKVLIVEDEQLITEFIEFLLRQEGHEPMVARDGDVVVPLMRKDAPALVLLDLMLPTVDGFEVLRQVKAAPDLKAIPVIVLTARSRDPDIALAFEMGASDYLSKPFSPTELIVRVNKTLKQAGPKGKS
jgi:DNA-binding response OmpR family regulator